MKLRRVTAKSRGLYRCEVSAEAPNFSSDRAERRMEIICEFQFCLFFLTRSLPLIGFGTVIPAMTLAQGSGLIAEAGTITTKKHTTVLCVQYFSNYHPSIVADMPKDNPHITPQEHEFYQLGDILRLNCTTSKSHPAQQITWLINDQPVMTIYMYKFLS